MNRIIFTVVVTLLFIVGVACLYKGIGMDATIASGLLAVIATVSSPFLVISITEYLAGKKAKQERQLSIFKTLMSTRGDGCSQQHVDALNQIDLEFRSQIPAEKEVLSAWTSYHSHLSSLPRDAVKEQLAVWSSKKEDLLVSLLMSMSRAMVYEFDETRIKKGHYLPIAFEKRATFEDGILAILKGERSISVKVKAEEVLSNQ